MIYMGSKRRIARHIIPIMVDAADRAGITQWVEPFVGGANLIDKVPARFKRHGYDLNPHTIEALRDIRDRPEQLPDVVTVEQYDAWKGTPPASVTSWARFVCSFGAKFEGGYAYNGERNYAAVGKRNALRQSPHLHGVRFLCSNHGDIRPDHERSLVYCDPPYQGTAGYKTGSFDHGVFFEWCRAMARAGHLVFVSEYAAPDDFFQVWRGGQTTSLTNLSDSLNATERLFVVPRS